MDDDLDLSKDKDKLAISKDIKSSNMQRRMSKSASGFHTDFAKLQEVIKESSKDKSVKEKEKQAARKDIKNVNKDRRMSKSARGFQLDVSKLQEVVNRESS